MNRNRLILLAVALFAIATGLFGYTGLWREITRPADRHLRVECYQIINDAQLFYMRPRHYGGSGGTFAIMDAYLLGYVETPGTTEWTGKNGTFRLENLTLTSFDLIATGKKGKQIAFRNVEYDTRVE